MAVNTGKFLRVNLSTGKTAAEPVPEQAARDFVGGRGYGIKYLYDELPPNVDPFSEENRLPDRPRRGGVAVGRDLLYEDRIQNMR